MVISLMPQTGYAGPDIKSPVKKNMGSKLPCLFVKLIWCTGATSNPSRGIGYHSVLAGTIWFSSSVCYGSALF